MFLSFPIVYFVINSHNKNTIEMREVVLCVLLSSGFVETCRVKKTFGFSQFIPPSKNGSEKSSFDIPGVPCLIFSKTVVWDLTQPKTVVLP